MTEVVADVCADAPPDADFETAPAVPQYWYDERRGRYWHVTERGEWVDKSEKQLVRWLKQSGVRTFADAKGGEAVSPAEEILIDSETDRRVFYAGPLAGYPAGLHDMEGSRILVTKGPKLIEPEAGDWPLLQEFFEKLLSCPKDECDQRVHFYGWLRHLLETLYEGYWTRGLCLAIAGEPESGKSLLLELVKRMSGGRIAKPYRYMIGQDNFNEEMFEATLLAIDDENADTNIKARRHFAAQIKQIVANGEARMRGMHQKATTLRPIWRLMVCLNMEPDNLMVLPPVDEDIADKMMLLKGYSGMKFPRGPAAEHAFFQQLVDELPSFVHWLLNEWELPEELYGRFGVRHYHHPELLKVLDEMAPFHRLHELIEQSVLRTTWYWHGSTSELERALKDENNGLLKADRDWIPQPAWLGRHLERLRKKLGEDRYRLVRSNDARVWHIFRHDYPHNEDKTQ